MIRQLKSAKSSEVRAEEDATVRQTVEEILADIEKRGDDAVRELSRKFDSYSPENFRLSDSEIEAAMQKVASRDMDDIKFAQTQIRNFAEAQRASMTDIEIARIVRLQKRNPAVAVPIHFIPGQWTCA